MDLLPALQPRKLILTLNISNILPALLAELVQRGPLTVLDSGNRFPAYRIVQEIRKRGPHIKEGTERLFLRRAFTAYQTLHLLESASATAHPHILLDLLAPLQDDQLHLREADRLLTQYLLHIERLALNAPILLCLTTQVREEKSFLLQRLTDRADQIFTRTNPTLPQPSQLPLFP